MQFWFLIFCLNRALFLFEACNIYISQACHIYIYIYILSTSPSLNLSFPQPPTSNCTRSGEGCLVWVSFHPWSLGTLLIWEHSTAVLWEMVWNYWTSSTSSLVFLPFFFYLSFLCLLAPFSGWSQLSSDPFIVGFFFYFDYHVLISE